jgi:hypothetical protein
MALTGNVIPQRSSSIAGALAPGGGERWPFDNRMSIFFFSGDYTTYRRYGKCSS